MARWNAVVYLLSFLLLTGCLRGGEVEPRNEVVAIWGVDVETGEVKRTGEAAMPADGTVEERLQALADQVSALEFSDRPIRLREVRETDRGRLAVFDLINPADADGPRGRGTWFQAFQGSFGGMASQSTLFNTFLQPGIGEPWVDGVAFEHEHGVGTHAEWMPGPVWREQIDMTIIG